MIAREGGAPVTCAADGSFEPLQCQPVGGLFQCQCINPSDGGAIPSTEVVVANVDDAPDCDRLGEHLVASGLVVCTQTLATKKFIYVTT